ncbi:hypothetical protein SNE40_012347 [Patella caerulea]|uniref:C2H2-type domain-containing protein n=2 Tax=Patella caerulea TaxID=87958 RepID=A0AAN8PVS3_PATCE
MDPSIKIKPEPIDTEYEQQANSPVTHSRSGKNSSSWGSTSQIRDVMSKGKESNAPKLRNVVDSLLQKNEQLLAQNDAIAFKPNPRMSRMNFDSRKSEAGILCDSTFLVSQSSQARITKSRGKEQDLVAGRLLRPRSPTRRCTLAEKDKNHLNMAIMESKLQDRDSEKVFRVQKHDLVSAISCKAMFSSQEGKIAANIDLTYYWCNFCPYVSTSKPALLSHIMDHRFNCKYCKYQSFSRADVIRHSTRQHEEFSGMATSLKYCTLLSDYLQVKTQSTEEDRKRAAEDENEDNPNKIRRVEEENDEDSNSSSCNGSQSDKIHNNDDYEFFDMEVEEIEENNDHGNVTEEPMEDLPQLPQISSNFNNSNTRPRNTAIRSKPFTTPQQHSPSQNYSSEATAMQIVPNIMGHQATVQTVSTPTSSNNRPAVKPRAKNTPLQKTPTKPGSTVSSSLYWSCGYCSFKSDTQWKIKHHSVSKHAGKPHRYVALILPAGATGLNQEEDNESSSSATEKDLELDVADDSDDSTSNQSSGKRSMNGKQTARKSGNGSWKVNLK